jgi:HEAT repeat protein
VGLLDIFSGAPADKARKLKAKVIQKYGDPTVRQKAIATLGEMKDPAAVASLMARFTVTVEPGTTDSDEKDQVFELVVAFGQDAIAPVKEFLKRSDSATSWAMRILERLMPEPELVGHFIELLGQIGAEYTRDPEKKSVVIHYLTGKDDPRIAAALLPFLEDPADDIKIAALKGLAPLKDDRAREPILQLLTGSETARRVQTACVSALQEAGFGVQGFREKVEALVADPYFVDKSGVVKKRG